MPMKCTLKMDKMQVLWLYICMSIYTMHTHVLSHVRLCNTMSCSPPGSSVQGISQARILEWITISSSRGSSRPREQTHVTCFSRTGRRVLYHWATWEAPIYTVHTHIYNHYKHFFNHWKKKQLKDRGQKKPTGKIRKIFVQVVHKEITKMALKCKKNVETHSQLLLSHFSRVRLWATPQTEAHQAPLSLGFSRQEHWSGLPFPSPMHESEKWKWSCSVVSNPQQPHGLQPTRLLHPWDFPGKSTGVGCHCLLRIHN